MKEIEWTDTAFSGTFLHVESASSTVQIGASMLPGCIEVGNSDGSAGINYVTFPQRRHDRVDNETEQLPVMRRHQLGPDGKVTNTPEQSGEFSKSIVV